MFKIRSKYIKECMRGVLFITTIIACVTVVATLAAKRTTKYDDQDDIIEYEF